MRAKGRQEEYRPAGRIKAGRKDRVNEQRKKKEQLGADRDGQARIEKGKNEKKEGEVVERHKGRSVRMVG